MTNKAYAVISGASAAMEGLYDPFDGSSLDATKWAAQNFGAGGSVSEGSGVLSVAVNAGISQEVVYSDIPYDLTESYAYIQCVSSTVGENFGIALQPSRAEEESVNALYVQVASGVLYFGWRVSSGPANVSSTSWSGTGWWRIRESGGITYWDASSDGSTWTNQGSKANLFDVTALYPTLFSYNYTSIAAGVTEFANFNTTGTPSSYPGTVTASAAAFTSGGVPVGYWPSITAKFKYGDSNERIRRALVAAVQDAASDSTLDVDFVSG